MQQDKTFLGTEPVGQLLRRLAIPTVIAQLVNMLYNIVDRIYIGHIPEVGSSALTGVGVCLPIILIVSAFACFTASGGAPRASIYLGRDDMDSAEKTLGCCSGGATRCWPSARVRTPSATPPTTCIFMRSERSLSSSRSA